MYRNNSQLTILGIECSCDDLGVAIMVNGKIVSHECINQNQIHTPYQGIVPQLASATHCNNIYKQVRKVLGKISIDHINYIAYTSEPGLIGSLYVAKWFSYGLSNWGKIPLIPVNHLFAHLMAAKALYDIKYPFIGLVISGGHTIIMYYTTYNQYEIISTTIDDAVGEFLDKSARLMGLNFPGGPEIEKIAKKGIPLNIFPHSMENRQHFSFSGLKTSVKHKIESNQYSTEDICASIQLIVSKILLKKLITAIKQTECHRVIIAGGVSCNNYIRQYIQDYLKDTALYFAPKSLCTDNGVMVTFAAEEYIKNNTPDKK